MKMKVTMKMKLKVMVMVIVRMIMSRISDRSQRIEQHRGFPVTGVDTPCVTPSQVLRTSKCILTILILCVMISSNVMSLLRYFNRTSKRILTIENSLHDDFKRCNDKGQTVGHAVQVAASKNTLRRAQIPHCAPPVLLAKGT